MPYSAGLGALAEGIQSGVGLRSALMQQQYQKALTQEEQEKANQLGTLVPVQIGGQTYNVPQNQAADLMNQEQMRQLQIQYMQGMFGMRQGLQTGKLNTQEQARLDATKSAVPLHNYLTALYQAYQVSGQARDAQGNQIPANPSAFDKIMTTAKSYLADTRFAPLAESAARNPGNIPALYNAGTYQGAEEFNKLSTGSIQPMNPADIPTVQRTIFPLLADAPDVAYGKFGVYRDSYINGAFEGALQHFDQAKDASGNYTDPAIANAANAVQQEYQNTQKQLYQLPGYGPGGSPVPEVKGVIPSLTTNGAPLPVKPPSTPGNGGVPHLPFVVSPAAGQSGPLPSIPAGTLGNGPSAALPSIPQMAPAGAAAQAPGADASSQPSLYLPTMTPHPQPQRAPLSSFGF